MDTFTDTLTPAPPQAWSMAGALLDGLSNRDFAQMGACLAPDVRFRCLLPRGPVEVTGADETVAMFERWFGGEDAFEILDASVGQIGARIYLRWRVRMQAADGTERVAEQHLFTTGSEVIRTLDLLCSGFHAPGAAPACPTP